MSHFGKFAMKGEKKEEVNNVIREKIVYQKINPEEKFGLNIALAGMQTCGKSTLAGLFGYFNSKYVSRLDPLKFPNTIKLLKGGYMPEIERIQVLDLDNNYKKAASRGVFRDLVYPFIKDGTLEIFDKIKIPKREQKYKRGVFVDANVEQLEKIKRQVEAAIDQAVADNGPEVLFIIDSMTSYDELLNNRFKIIYESIMGTQSLDSIKGVKQAFWTIRNSWWNDTMKNKRGYKGWQVDTYKVIEIPEHFVQANIKKGKPAIREYIKWGSPNNESSFNLDMVYWLHRDEDGYPYVHIHDGRYKSVDVNDNINIKYTLKKKNAAFVLIEKMAPYLMEEVENEDDFW